MDTVAGKVYLLAVVEIGMPAAVQKVVLAVDKVEDVVRAREERANGREYQEYRLRCAGPANRLWNGIPHGA